MDKKRFLSKFLAGFLALAMFLTGIPGTDFAGVGTVEAMAAVTATSTTIQMASGAHANLVSIEKGSDSEALELSQSNSTLTANAGGECIAAYDASDSGDDSNKKIKVTITPETGYEISEASAGSVSFSKVGDTTSWAADNVPVSEVSIEVSATATAISRNVTKTNGTGTTITGGDTASIAADYTFTVTAGTG